MMNCDWIFLGTKTRQEATLQEPAVPALGDGKFHNNVGYEVRVVVTNRVGNDNPLVIATEIL